MLVTSMKTKMALAVFLLVGLLMSVTAVTSVLYYEQRFKQNISLQQSTLLDSLAYQVDNRISDFMSDLEQLAADIGEQTLANPHEAQSLLNAHKKQRVFFDNSLFLFSKTGHLIAASPKDLNFIGRDFSFREYFKQTLLSGKMYVSAPFASIQKQSHPIIMFSTPVYDSKHRIIGILGGSIDLRQQQYLRSLAALKLGQKGFLSLYDSNRYVLMHPNPKRVLHRDLPGTNDMVDRAIAGYEGTRESKTVAGLPVLRSVKRLKSTDWILSVSYPLSEVYAPLGTARNYFLAGSLAASLLSILIVWPFMGYLTRPILSFTRHLEQLPRLKGTQRLAPVTSDDEIGRMARTFNKMLLEQERSRDFYLTLFENFPAMIWRTRTDGKCDYFNQIWLEFTGRTMEEELGDGWLQGVHPDELDFCARTYLEAFENRRTFQMEYRLRHKSGGYRWITDMGRPFYGLDGEFAGYIGTCYDVTERQESANKILKLSRVIEQSPNAVLIATLDGTIEYVNPKTVEATGYAVKELVGSDMKRLLPHEEQTRFKLALRELARRGNEWRGDVPARRKDGTVLWEQVTLSPIKTMDGKVTHLVCTKEDITQRRQFELSLKESEERYRLLFENNPHPMWVYDLRALSFLAVNHAALRHYGYTMQEFLGLSLNDLAAGPGDGTQLPQLAEIRDGGTPLKRHVKKDGSVILVETTSQVMKFAGVDAEVVMVHDVTERIKAEQEKLALEHQLTQSQKMEAIGTLTGGIAHDFNNILTAIIGYTTMMQLELDEPHPLQRKVGEILRASERAASLTRSLLAYSRRQVGNPVPVGLNAIINNVDILLQRLIPENIELRLQLAPEELSIMADSGQIEQVIMNLVVNARDAMPDGGVLSLSTQSLVLDREFVAKHGYGGAGNYVLLSVADSGVGMDEKTRDRIFEPFFTTKAPGKGTGLGLAMVYGIVKQHGGFINCYSEPGHGTVFRIYLPRTDAPAEKEAAQADQELRGGDETILLVEDDAVIRDMVAELLEEFGYKVIKAVDGEDAVQKFQGAANEVQLVILDVIMPKRNGKEAYEDISRIRPGAKALFMSGYTADIITDSLIKGDPRHFVSKPICINDLMGKVRDLLDE
ncbi:calcium-binding protein [Geoanaerobacter pelophilus]|uniref:histidine kinase n=2 Tax=Geoanaerobacter pelophilus TaxID=60036 RepID=A0ABQ0MM54_9BACT|nr:calcium-binding protein [Geoanaerobacter pelophilus]